VYVYYFTHNSLHKLTILQANRRALGSSYVETRDGACSGELLPPRLRRWLQDTSKRKLADILILFAPPPLPVSPGSPEVDPTMDQNKRPG